MKKLVSMIGCSILAVSVLAQDSLSVFELADTSLAVAEEVINSMPSAGDVWQNFALWGVSALALVLGLINFLKGKKIFIKK